ncbi:MAG: hypothetical protein Q8K00_15260 [Syntrophales bacterium]|nr:hypothetical protein [Syntrophales bacterium]
MLHQEILDCCMGHFAVVRLHRCIPTPVPINTGQIVFYEPCLTLPLKPRGYLAEIVEGRECANRLWLQIEPLKKLR